MGILTVNLIKATNLKDEDVSGQSDPYILFELEQNNMMFDKDMGEMKSTTKQNDLNPVYNETFNFNIPTLDNMELSVKVMDDDKMGKCKIKLDGLDLSGSPTAVEEKVYNRVFGKDSYVHLELSYTE